MQELYQLLRNEIVTIATSYEEKILTRIHKTMDQVELFAAKHNNLADFIAYCNEQFKECEEDVSSLLYECLEKIYALVAKFVRKNYPGVKFDEVNVKTLTWNEDGLTLEDRVKKHIIDNSQKILELYKDGVFDYDSVQKVLDFELVRIMDTEAYVISNSILHDKLKKVSNYFEILGANCCENCDGGSGIKPISELKSIPPYHPNCRCMVVYYIDNPEEE